MNLKAVSLEIFNGHAKMVQLPAWENILHQREMFGAFAIEGFLIFLHAAGDGVMHVKATRTQKPVHGGEITVVILYTNVFEHSHRGYLIKLAV